MFSIFDRLGFGSVRAAVSAFRLYRAKATMARLPTGPIDLPSWLALLPSQYGIRQDVSATLGPLLGSLHPYNIPLRTLICGIINHGLRQITPLPRRADWQVLFTALASTGPILLMCNNPAVSLVNAWFKRVSVHGFRDMVKDLNDPECKTKYVCVPGIAATGWNCRNENVHVAIFNISNPQVIAQAEGRVRRVSSSTPE